MLKIKKFRLGTTNEDKRLGMIIIFLIIIDDERENSVIEAFSDY
jgi:hypothetical protein